MKARSSTAPEGDDDHEDGGRHHYYRHTDGKPHKPHKWKCITNNSRKTTMGNKLSGLHLPPIARRRFVQGLALPGPVAGLGLGPSSARRQDRAQSPSILRGMDFTLDIGATPVNFTGTPR